MSSSYTVSHERFRRLFSKAGYTVALVARGTAAVEKLAQELNSAGGDAVPFPVRSYAPEDVSAVWRSIRTTFAAPECRISVAIFNVAHELWKPFLDTTPADVKASLSTNVEAAFAFSREAILAFKDNDVEEGPERRGTLIFTGATASLRGNVTTSAFAAGKFGLRALSQSLAKEFGKENIHVAHSIIDGAILTERLPSQCPQLAANADGRLSPESIASSYLYLVNQDRSAWTWELDLRPAHEKW